MKEIGMILQKENDPKNDNQKTRKILPRESREGHVIYEPTQRFISLATTPKLGQMNGKLLNTYENIVQKDSTKVLGEVVSAIDI